MSYVHFTYLLIILEKSSVVFRNLYFEPSCFRLIISSMRSIILTQLYFAGGVANLENYKYCSLLFW